MAVNSFVIGHKYKISGDDLSTVGSYKYIPTRYLKVVFTDKSSSIFTGFKCFVASGSTWEVHYNNSDDETVWELQSGTISYIEFIFDYDSVDFFEDQVDDAYKSIAYSLGGNFAQVSIYNEHSGHWYDLPCASDYTGIATTVVDSARNVQAVVIGDVIASDIAKVELKWNYLTIEEYSFIAQLFEQKYNGSFFNAVRFFDVIKGDFDGDNSVAPNTTTNRCRLMYCGDRKVAFAKMKLDENGKPIGYQGVSLNLIDTNKIYGE